MEYVKGLQCVRCGARYAAEPSALTCPACGIEGILDVQFDYDLLASRWSPVDVDKSPDASMWRFAPLIPVDPATPRSVLRHGDTPLVPAGSLAAELGLGREDVWIKDEGRSPTGSLKDRASAVAVVKAREAGADVIACSSTGNAAASLAGAAASVGMQSVIMVPHYAAAGKVAQLLVFGSTVLSVQASYQDTFDLCQDACARYGWYNRNAAVNPYLMEGKKTAGLEVARQLGWQAPDWLVVSVGDGCTIAGLWKAFVDLQQLGWIDRLPKLLAVQAKGSPNMHRLYETGEWTPGPEDTIADGISVGLPKNGAKVVRGLRDSGGAFVLVSDEEILEAMALLGRTTGVFGEPSAGAALAGLRRAVAEDIVVKGERVVVMVTGNGLKDIKNAVAAAGEPIRVEAELQQVAAALPPALVAG